MSDVFGIEDDSRVKRCWTCKWWGDDNVAGEAQPVEHHLCESPRIVYRWGGKKMEEGGASYSDEEGYDADFATTATFGCSCWEPKE